MSMDPNLPGAGHGAAPTQPLAASVTRSPGTDDGPNAGVMAPDGRVGVYVYPFWQRSEFLVFVLLALAVAIAAAVDDGFDARGSWLYITILGAAYILSRGLAKREPRDDSADRPATPGGSSGGGRFSGSR